MRNRDASKPRKLRLHLDTVRNLATGELERAAAGIGMTKPPNNLCSTPQNCGNTDFFTCAC